MQQVHVIKQFSYDEIEEFKQGAVHKIMYDDCGVQKCIALLRIQPTSIINRGKVMYGYFEIEIRLGSYGKIKTLGALTYTVKEKMLEQTLFKDHVLTNPIDGRDIVITITNDSQAGIQDRMITKSCPDKYMRRRPLIEPFILTENVMYFVYVSKNEKGVLLKARLMPYRFQLTEEIVNKLNDVLITGTEAILSESRLNDNATTKLSISYVHDTDSFHIHGAIYSDKKEYEFLDDILDRKSLVLFYDKCKTTVFDEIQ